MAETKLQAPLLELLKQNLPILITIFTLIASIFFYAFRVDTIEKALAGHTEDAKESTVNQTEILKKLAVIEAKQDRNTEDVQEILKELKTIR